MDTRQAAYDSVDRVTLRDLSLAQIRVKPMTADEVAHRLGQGVMTIRPRMTELRKLGLAKDSGVRRPNMSGRKAIVWELCA